MASCKNSSQSSTERAYADIMIKIQDEIYHLDRLRLALKSDYFENLFIDDFDEKNRNMIEIPIMDSDTFSAIVDIIYSKDDGNADVLPGITEDNYVSVLIAMDYFQMEIDLEKFLNFLQSSLKSDSDEEIFRLYDFIVAKQFEYLLPGVFQYLSRNLKRVGNRQEFLSLPFHHLAKVISSEKNVLWNRKEQRLITRTCTEWIFHDVGNRLPLIVKLANVVRYTLGFSSEVTDGNPSIKLDNAEQRISREIIETRFHKLLAYTVEVDTNASVTRKLKKYEESDLPKIINKINGKDKMYKFLKNEDFSDIIVRTAEKTYKLHRCIVASESGYFSSICSAGRKVSSTSTQNLNRDEEYSIDEIDSITFDLVVKHVYFNELSLTADNVVLVLKAADFLDIKKLFEECESWTRSNIKDLSSESIVHQLNFTSKKASHERDFILFLWKELIMSRPGVDISQFSSISFDMLEDLLSSSDIVFDDVGKILETCCKWIMRDVANRYNLIPRVAFAISRSYVADYDDCKIETPTDFNNCSLELVQREVLKVLSATSLVPSFTKSAPSIRKSTEIPVFIALAKEYTGFCILNLDMDVIARATLCHTHSVPPNYDYVLRFYYNISTTTINDNVFIAIRILESISFHVYNPSSKKFFSLPSFSSQIIPTAPMVLGDSHCSLLSCCNEVYCSVRCSRGNSHRVMKYSTTFNRWMLVLEQSNVVNVRCTSDGKMLYVIFRKTESNYKIYVAQKYCVDEKLWFSMPSLPATDSYDFVQLTTLSNGDLTALFENNAYLFDEHEQKWKILSLPYARGSVYISPFFSSLSSFEDEILYLKGDELYCSPPYTPRWELKKDGFLRNLSPCIAPVHRLRIAVTQTLP